MKNDTSSIIILGVIAVFAWFLFFGLGLFINSAPYRTELMTHLDIKAFFISLFTYTPTNIAFLCLAAAFCGGCSSNLVLSSKFQIDRNNNANSENVPSLLKPQNPFNCMIRGFVVYVAFLGGMYVVVNSPFSNTSPEQYARAAGVVSLLSYVVGYDQSNFLNLISMSSKLKKEAD